MDHDFAVGGRLKQRAVRLEPVAQLVEIDQVAVVREREPPRAYSTTSGWQLLRVVEPVVE